MADSPEQAARPGTTAPDRVYEGDGITVEWRATRCIHTAHCLRAAPDVFDVRARPWIDLDGADPALVAEAVRACPTGALRHSGPGLPPDGDDDEQPVVAPQPGGPLFIRGRVRVIDADGAEITTEPRLALCRCGRSGNEPYCDNSHRLPGAQDPTTSQ